MVGSSQKSQNLCQNNDEGRATNYMSVIAHVYQRPRCMDDDTPAGDHEPASTRSCRPRQKTTSNGDGPVRSYPTHLPTSSPRFKSGKQMHCAFQNHERDIWTSSRCDQSLGDSTGWNTVDDQDSGNVSHTTCCTCDAGILGHPVSGISGVDPHGTIRGHSACIATKRATRDEEQEEQCCESSGDSMGARQSLTKRQPGNPVEEGAERLRHPPTAIQKGGNAVKYYERCKMRGNRWQRIPLTMVERDPETKLNNRTVLASTGKRPFEIERPFCPHGHGSMMMQASPQQSLCWECSTCSATSGLSLDGCDVRLVDRVSFEGADANMVPIGDDETPCL